MTDAPKRPFYSAALLNPADLTDRSRDYTPLGIADAENDKQAIDFAIRRGTDWLVRNGIDWAVLHIVRDAHAFYSEPLRVTR